MIQCGVKDVMQRILIQQYRIDYSVQQMKFIAHSYTFAFAYPREQIRLSTGPFREATYSVLARTAEQQQQLSPPSHTPPVVVVFMLETGNSRQFANERGVCRLKKVIVIIMMLMSRLNPLPIVVNQSLRSRLVKGLALPLATTAKESSFYSVSHAIATTITACINVEVSFYLVHLVIC